MSNNSTDKTSRHKEKRVFAKRMARGAKRMEKGFKGSSEEPRASARGFFK